MSGHVKNSALNREFMSLQNKVMAVFECASDCFVSIICLPMKAGRYLVQAAVVMVQQMESIRTQTPDYQNCQTLFDLLCCFFLYDFV